MEPTTADRTRDELVDLCAIFKAEVYRRTARIGTITMVGAGVLLAGMLAFGMTSHSFRRGERLVCAIGVGVFVASLLLQITREASRHARAKQGLIRIERAMGLFDVGRYLPGESLYPPEWTTPPPRERATVPSYLFLGMLALLFVVEILGA